MLVGEARGAPQCFPRVTGILRLAGTWSSIRQRSWQWGEPGFVLTRADEEQGREGGGEGLANALPMGRAIQPAKWDREGQDLPSVHGANWGAAPRPSSACPHLAPPPTL